MSLFQTSLTPLQDRINNHRNCFSAGSGRISCLELQFRCKNDLLAQKTEEAELQLRKDTKTNWIHWGWKRASLEAQQQELETKLRNSDSNAEALKTQLDNVNSQLKNVNASFYKVKSDLDNLSNSISIKALRIQAMPLTQIYKKAPDSQRPIL